MEQPHQKSTCLLSSQNGSTTWHAFHPLIQIRNQEVRGSFDSSPKSTAFFHTQNSGLLNATYNSIFSFKALHPSNTLMVTL